MHSQEFGNDEAKSSDPLAVVAIIPEKVPHNGREQIVIAFNKRIPVKGRGQFMVDFVGTAGALQVPARQLNSSTLLVETPEYPIASVVTAHVYQGIHRRLLGQHTFEFLSRNDAFYRLLYGALDPVKFMCESLNISPAELQGLDVALAETFKANAPEGFNLLGIHKDVAGDSTAEHPTLLHFASEFGLSRLISNLFLFPGAQEACKIRNYHRQCPYEIAEAHGFRDLANTLCTFLDQGDPDQIYTDMEHGEGEYYTRMQKGDGSYIYVPMEEEGHGLYVEMNGKKYINLDKDGEGEDVYVKKQSEDGSYHYVPMKGNTGDFCKIYEETTDRRLCPQVQNQPESDQYTSVDSEIYQNYEAGTASDGQEVYEDMERNPEGQDNPEELYTCMDMDSTNQMSNPEHFGYVKPRSNLPVNPDPAFYRSASNAAAVRAKEIENERKVRSLPPSKGAMSSLDLLQSTLQQNVAEGNLTEEEVAKLMKKMRISGAVTGPKSSSLTPRRGSTSSRSSTSTTSSSGSYSSGISSGHEFTQHPERDGYYKEDEEIHGNLQDLFPQLKQSGKICNDIPPPVPQPDYDKEEKTARSYGKRKDHSRSRTTPVNREDIQAGLSSTSTPPQTFARRRSEPPPTGSGLDVQSKLLPKTYLPQPSERPPAPIPESESSRPPKSPPAPAPTPRSKMPPMGIPVFPEGPAPPTPQRVLPPSTLQRDQPPPTPQRIPRAAPRGTSK
ncbi:phosphoinositide 3-kinase adapter protein 1-like isoform X2 [Orbicella faveolata]|uniref:phosphoinositide 3-kinase adapter protein 1-like isoform X2 n=1 Tax=Orbicella faveolata TaxID=48498 RepID=UPI0009E5A798|nr:phosphoinositide 3-kinase adapter protein 1-like isoform X2 [Orbicella faveolata]